LQGTEEGTWKAARELIGIGEKTFITKGKKEDKQRRAGKKEHREMKAGLAGGQYPGLATGEVDEIKEQLFRCARKGGKQRTLLWRKGGVRGVGKKGMGTAIAREGGLESSIRRAKPGSIGEKIGGRDRTRTEGSSGGGGFLGWSDVLGS